MTVVFVQVLESCVKNCGSLIQREIGTKSYMEQYKNFIEKCTDEKVKTKALDLLQSWAYAFRNLQKYRPVCVRILVLVAVRIRI